MDVSRKITEEQRTQNPEFILFVQHGWADDNRAMIDLGQRLVTDTTPVVAPNLGYIQTWIRITPLIKLVENIAIEQMAKYPDVPIRIIGHSMGGLIWLELLNRHPQWWAKVHSLVLVASPVGGADLGRIVDPLNLGIGVARDLGKNRKAIAQQIAAVIPTLAIAGDIDDGSDGTIPVGSTKFANAKFICLRDLSHAVLRNHPLVASTIRNFWLDSTIGEAIIFDHIVQRLHAVPGITDGHWRDFYKAKVVMKLNNGGTIRTWRNLVGVDHVFVASPQGKCLYAGFVGWMHAQELRQALEDIRQAYAV
ncbi:MAG: alpha/beta hydrolase [Chlorogloeopsis fritschii C42_A2020_084]|uniref:alpha/beta fold hydrolase n=1 Tax=Chlorogloeopsis fritschii TaxID=1124 RepID=UPI001A0E5770|nr:alpha/beta hydrolase [Chlorogloeopsis fritschii]MBF2004895.1 alpha/beta hydrolase [Chlorogloeopsis fritschii C42_A2020_084]